MVHTKIFFQSRYYWNVDHETFGDGFHYHCFIMTKGQALNEVTIHSAADISKVTLNMNDNYDSSSDEENFTSRLDLSFESDDNDSFESLPNDQMNGLSID